MPRQSHGAAAVDASHPSNAPSGSCRLALKAVKAWISDRVWALVKTAPLKHATAKKTKKKKVAVAIVIEREE